MSSDSWKPKILIFSTNLISDVGIDYTGLMHLHYPASTAIIRLPCSSMIRPEFILHAFRSGFDAVFVAADGTDCPYLSDCSERTAKRVEEASKLIVKHGIEPERLKMAAICSVCAEPFVNHVKNLYDAIRKLGPVKEV